MLGTTRQARAGDRGAGWSSAYLGSFLSDRSDGRVVGPPAQLLVKRGTRCAAQAALASLLMTRRASVQIRSTIEAKPFERCGVKCSANSRRRNTPSASILTISSAHRPE